MCFTKTCPLRFLMTASHVCHVFCNFLWFAIKFQSFSSEFLWFSVTFCDSLMNFLDRAWFSHEFHAYHTHDFHVYRDTCQINENFIWISCVSYAWISCVWKYMRNSCVLRTNFMHVNTHDFHEWLFSSSTRMYRYAWKSCEFRMNFMRGTFACVGKNIEIKEENKSMESRNNRLKCLQNRIQTQVWRI